VVVVPGDQLITTELLQQVVAQEMEHVAVQQTPVVVEQIAHRHLLVALVVALAAAEL
jgi:hypothetical protein